MTYEARIRRLGWIAIFAVCAALYLALHLKVQSVKSELVLSERQIVALEEQNLLLETEFQTRSSQLQLALWNRVDFGFSPPESSQFIRGEQQLAMLGTMPGGPGPGGSRPGLPGAASADVQLASYSPGDFAAGPADELSEPEIRPENRPELRSPLTGERIDPALLAAGDRGGERQAPRLAMVMPSGATRIQLSALAD